VRQREGGEDGSDTYFLLTERERGEEQAGRGDAGREREEDGGNTYKLERERQRERRGKGDAGKIEGGATLTSYR
jgi:hypothetical protein